MREVGRGEHPWHLRRTLARFGPSRWPTTADGADEALMTFAVTTRVGLLLIAGLPMSCCAQTSPRPLLCLAMTVACVGVSAG